MTRTTKPLQPIKRVNFQLHKILFCDFIPSGIELCRYIRTFMPTRDYFKIHFIYVFFSPNVTLPHSDESDKGFRLDFVFSENWMQSTTVQRLGLNPLSLWKTYTFIGNPTLWQQI